MVIDKFNSSGALPHVAIIGKDFRLKFSETGATVEDVVVKLGLLLDGKSK